MSVLLLQSSNLDFVYTGTASSNEDKFSYAERGLCKGHLYGFGLGLTFKEELSQEQVQGVQKTLGIKGYAAKFQSSKFAILFLNGELKHLLEQHQVKTVPILNTFPFVTVFGRMASDLLKHQVEGFVIVIPSKSIALKWKGYEDCDPRRVESFIDITDECKLAEAIAPLNEVLQESILYHAHGRKRYLDPSLSIAYNSARSKFPRLDDILSNYKGDPGQKAKIIEGYKFTIIDEITKDFGKAFGCTTNSINAFVNAKVKAK